MKLKREDGIDNGLSAISWSFRRENSLCNS